MKKKAIKIAASTAVAASAFVAAAPTNQADAAVNVNQLVSDAQNAGTVLKWAISVEGSADFVTQPLAQYNAAKKSIAAAEAAAAKLSVSEKLSADAKLVDAKIQVTRAGYYIDAITSSNKIKSLTATLDAAIASGDIAKVEAAYHAATGEFRKQAKLLDRVYGQTTRDEIRNAVKPALEKSVASVKNEVTVNMLVAAAAADVKAGKIAEAHAKIAEAQAIIDANNLKWEAALQKSVTDAQTGLPSIPGNITVDTAAFHGEKGNVYAVTANIKTKAGAAYNGKVKISFDEKGKTPGETNAAPVADTYELIKVNGKTLEAADNKKLQTVEVVNGQLVLTVTSPDAIAGGKLKFETLASNGSTIDTQYSGALNFYERETGSKVTLDSKTVKYVDAANNYFVTSDLKKFILSSTGNVFQDTNDAVITLDAFKAKLAAGDILRGTYNYDGGSVIQLWVHKVAEAEFALDQEVVNGTDAYRVEGSSVKLSGTGEAGKRVAIYKTEGADSVTAGTQALTTVTVGSNGLWSATVSVTTKTTFGAYQILSVNDPAPAYSTGEELTVVPGQFTAKAGHVNVDTSLTNQTLVFTADLASDRGETAVVATNAQITLLDGDLTRATYVNGVNGTVISESSAGFEVKFGAPSTISGGDGKLSGPLTINSVTGVANAYGFKAVVSGTVTTN